MWSWRCDAREMPLSDEFRSALVTGASSGLGAAFTDMLLAEGVQVWGTARARERVADRPRFHGLALELSDPASIAAAWAGAEEASGGIDLLINNAGAGLFGPFAQADEREWARQIEVLLLGPARLAQLGLRAMMSRNRGCVVNVASLAVDFPIPYMSAYDAAKAGLSALSASLDLEGAGSEVRVIDFRPGDYRTTFNSSMRPTFNQAAADAPRRVWDRLEALLRDAPEPTCAARDLRIALAGRRRGVVRSGGFFQARLAPFLHRFASSRLSARVQRRYFRLD